MPCRAAFFAEAVEGPQKGNREQCCPAVGCSWRANLLLCFALMKLLEGGLVAYLDFSCVFQKDRKESAHPETDLAFWDFLHRREQALARSLYSDIFHLIKMYYLPLESLDNFSLPRAIVFCCFEGCSEACFTKEKSTLVFCNAKCKPCV